MGRRRPAAPGDRAGQRNGAAARVYNADGAFDPEVTRAALGAVDTPVLVLAGELDWIASPAVAGEFAALFPDGRVVVMPGAAHYPWLDDARRVRVSRDGFPGLTPDCASA